MFYGTLLLTGANLALRLVSMGYQVYLSGRIGPAGIGLLQLIISVRSLAFVLGAAGSRVCAMYLAAEVLGRGRPQGIHAVLSGCFRYGLLCGALTAVGLWQLTPRLAGGWIGDMAAAPALYLSALYLPIGCLCGIMTGYFTAAGRIRDLVAVEFLEQACAMSVTFLLLAHWAGEDSGRACFSVTAGACSAGLCSLLSLLFLHHGSIPKPAAPLPPPYGRIVKMALPLGLADTLRAGLSMVENLLIPKRLALFAGTVNALADYGVLHGMVFPVLMFPAAILFSLSELLVPEFSRCAAGGRRKRVRYLARRSLRVSLLFGLAAGGFLFVWAGALGEILYENDAVGVYLRLYAPFVPILYMDSVVDAMCKGLGQQNANVRYNILTTLLDVVLLWGLLPRLGMSGYYFSFALSHLVNFALSLRRLLKVSEIGLSLGTPLRGMLATAAAALAAALLSRRLGLAGLAGPGLCYLALLAACWSLFQVVDQEDLRWLWSLGRQKTVQV